MDRNERQRGFMNGPLVSIVIPVYRGAKYLPQLIESLAVQTYPNIEILAAVTPSGDGSEDLLESAGISVSSTPTGTGAAQNWTRATELGSGVFTKLICQDDVLYPTAIEQQVSDLVAHPGAVMAIAVRDIIDDAGRTLFRNRGLAGLPRNTSVMVGSKVLQASYVHGGNIFGEPLAVLFRTDALLDSMPWRDDNPLMLDLNTYTKVAMTGDIAISHKSIGAFRVSATSWSTKLAGQQLKQTQIWQKEYEEIFNPPKIMRVRATIGRYIQTNTRRAAYLYLNARGSLG